MMWYIWLSENSPLFGKDKMATFERYFLAEKETHKEKKNPYYNLFENEKVNSLIEIKNNCILFFQKEVDNNTLQCYN